MNTGSPIAKSNNVILDNRKIYIALFFTQLTAIIAQGSLRSGTIELLIQILVWGFLLGLSLSLGWHFSQQPLHHHGHTKKNSLPERLTNSAALIGIGALLFQLINNNLTAGLLLMLSWLLVGLGFSLQRQRSLYFALGASSVLLLYASSISKSSSFMIYLVIYTLAATITLTCNFILSKTKQQASPCNTSEATDFPLKLPISLLTVIILLITSALYLLVPRPDAIHWGGFQAGGGHYQADSDWPQNGKKNARNKDPQHLENDRSASAENHNQAPAKERKAGDFFYYSGFNDELELNDPSRKQHANRLILYMEGKHPQYLRGNIYDYFDGLSWKTTRQTKKRLQREHDKFVLNADREGPYEQYTITLVAHIAGKANIFIPADTAELQFPSNAIAEDNYGALFAPDTISKDTFYSVNVNKARFNGRPLEPATANNTPSQAELKHYTQLPGNLDEKFYELSDKITQGSDDVMQKAGKVEQFLRKNYQYSIDSVYSSQGKIPLQEFLFERPRGHCEYFATAMVTLMRAQQIPARLVTGFSVTEYNTVTGYYEARSLDAHAWAEVWDPNTGWVTFEATPPYTLPTPSHAQNTSQSIEEYLQQRSDDTRLADPESVATALLNTAKQAFQTINILMKITGKGFRNALVWSVNLLIHYGWLILILLAIIYTMAHYLRYYLVHARASRSLDKAKKQPPLQQLQTCYAVVGTIFALYQQPRPGGWTIQQYQASLSTHFPSLNQEIAQISQSLNSALYEHPYPLEQPLATDALKNAYIIINHSFTKPRPAEKLIQALQNLLKEPLIKS